MSWFCNRESLLAEIESLKTELLITKATLSQANTDKQKAQEALDVQKIWSDRVEYERMDLMVQCQMYEKIMHGLRINVNLAGKTKKDS
jgi:hypothetical protein